MRLGNVVTVICPVSEDKPISPLRLSAVIGADVVLTFTETPAGTVTS